MRRKSRRSRACDLTPQLKAIVRAGDNGRCIICGAPGLPNAHYIARSQGGLGIEENIVTLCPACHMEYDNGTARKRYAEQIRSYLRSRYNHWDETKLVYDKWENLRTSDRKRSGA